MNDPTTDGSIVEDMADEFGIEYETPSVHRGVWDGWYTSEFDARRTIREYPPEWRPRLVRRRVSAPEAVE